jgi:3-hydroxyisobutyrate dehydrogenase-like beta-hydroxyacid dehydrogenase
MAHPRIGFIGVGLMGHGMAKNLVEKGFPLTILGNKNRAPVEDLLARGAKEVKTAADLAKASDILFLCVTDSTVIEALVRGENGIKAGAHKGLIVVDCSTALPDSTRALAAELAPMGVDFVDAPLGGTPVQAEEGKLTAMVGASDALFAKVKPAIEAWAATIRHIGPLGAGHTMKLVNNFIAMGYAALYSEAFVLARKSGISVQTVHDVISGGRMDSGFFQTFTGYALTGDRNSHKFTISNALKDIRYVEAMGHSARILNPVANTAKNYFAAAVAVGQGEAFIPLVTEVVADMNGLPRQDFGATKKG